VENNKIIYQGYVVNNQDPLMMGRVRAVPVSPYALNLKFVSIHELGIPDTDNDVK
jgi:hypothetical protein